MPANPASTPETVNHDAPPEELRAAVEPSVHALMDDLSQTTAPEVRAAVTEAVAAEVTPTAPGRDPSDMSRLLAAKIDEVYRSLGLPSPGLEALEAEALAYGEGVSAPMPGDPRRQMPLTPEQVRERVARARGFSQEILSHPSEKKRRTIEAIRSSPAMTFWSPEAFVYRVNDVTIEVPEGEVLARDHVGRGGLPDGDEAGCAYVARLVFERGAARRWEEAQQKLLKHTVIYGEVEDRPAEFSGIPQRGRIY